MGAYNYRVLRQIDPSEISVDDNHPHRDGMLQLVGEFRAKEPGLAALAAAEQIGETGIYIAVPERNFNVVPIVPTTGFMVGELEPEDPPPPPADGEGVTSVSDLAPGLNPEHPCETEDCAHLPMLHGAKGLGMCRVDDCPCGEYKPAP